MIGKSQFNINLGDELRELRTELDLTQAELAEKAGLATNYLGEVERGEKSITVYYLYLILKAVNYPIENFLERM